MGFSPIFRYPEARFISSVLDPYQDVKNLITAFCARDVVKEVLILKHQVSRGEAAKRAARIVAHTKTALQFLEQAEESAIEVSFVPAYYAILNLLKVYILAGPLAGSLHEHSLHGASRGGPSIPRAGLLAETICLYPRGILSLFLESCSNGRLKPTSRSSVRMGDLYRLIVDVSSELHLATGHSGDTVQVKVGERHEPGKQLKVLPFLEFAPTDNGNGRRRPSLLGKEFYKVSSVPGRFEVAGLKIPDGKSAVEVLSPFIATEFLYYPMGGLSLVSVAPRRLLFPEEFPLALLFFHMSSVTRYNPEFLWRIRDSKHWPIVSAARRHGLFKMLLLFWCFMQKETLLINHNI